VRTGDGTLGLLVVLVPGPWPGPGPFEEVELKGRMDPASCGSAPSLMLLLAHHSCAFIGPCISIWKCMGSCPAPATADRPSPDPSPNPDPSPPWLNTRLSLRKFAVVLGEVERGVVSEEEGR
jgi:hypothetical protein